MTQVQLSQTISQSTSQIRSYRIIITIPLTPVSPALPLTFPPLQAYGDSPSWFPIVIEKEDNINIVYGWYSPDDIEALAILGYKYNTAMLIWRTRKQPYRLLFTFVLNNVPGGRYSNVFNKKPLKYYADTYTEILIKSMMNEISEKLGRVLRFAKVMTYEDFDNEFVFKLFIDIEMNEKELEELENELVKVEKTIWGSRYDIYPL